MANPNGSSPQVGDPAAPYNVVTFGGNDYLVTADTLPQVYQSRIAYLENQQGTKLTFDERAAENVALRQLAGFDNGFYEYNHVTGTITKVRDIGNAALDRTNPLVAPADWIRNAVKDFGDSFSNGLQLAGIPPIPNLNNILLVAGLVAVAVIVVKLK